MNSAKLYIITFGRTRKFTPSYKGVVGGGGGRWWMESPPEFLIFCNISKRFYLYRKAFDLLNKMKYILWMVALLEACGVTNNGRLLGIQRLIYKLTLLSFSFCLEKTGKHKQVMSAIVTTVLRGTIGLLLKKGRQSASKKLRDGDVADEQLRSWTKWTM